jgi:hypothetical protein
MFEIKEKIVSALISESIRRRIFQSKTPFKVYFAMRSRYRHLIVNNNTEIVIEGFARSGNTFAVAAFEQAQSRAYRIARHTHAPAQISMAAELNKPILLLKRHPVDAVASLITRNPNISVTIALGRYNWYYEQIRRYLDRCVVADFNEITSDYGSILRKINDKYQTDFNLYLNSPLHDLDVFRAVEAYDIRVFGKLARSHISRPSEKKQDLLNVARLAVTCGKYDKLLAECLTSYRSL